MGNQPSVEDHCHQVPWWTSAVRAASSTAAYRQVLDFMFEDGKFNRGRLKVLQVFTNEVCLQYPHLSVEVQEMFEETTALFRAT